jgi:hypothetical protein
MMSQCPFCIDFENTIWKLMLESDWDFFDSGWILG